MTSKLLPLFLLLTPSVCTKVEQVHLSLSGKMDEMVVTWITMDPLPNITPYVAFGVSKDALRWTAKANTTSWKDQGKGKVVRYTHRATMQNMLPGDVYYYQVGSSQSMSDTFHFTQPDPSKPLRAAIFGDLSILKGQQTIDQLIASVQNHQFDVIIHIGDLAYDLHDDDGNNGDLYMNAIQPFAAYVPYMVFAGNHEVDSKFNHIVNRFTMPKNGVYDDNLFWSFDYGFVHFIALNSEYYAEEMTKQSEAQFKWLETELEKSTAQWKIVMFHRPWYCSSKKKKGCHDDQDMLSRKGEPGFPGLEDLLYKSKVDLVLYGHKHTYERMWPIYNKDPFKSADPGHIKNAKAPVYMLTGGAGCHSHEDPSDHIQQDFSVLGLGEYGYTFLTIHNTTHLTTDFVDTSVPEVPNVTPYVTYGLSKDSLRWTAKAHTTSWKDQGKHGYVRYTHRATMTQMVPGDEYYYQVGSSQSMSDTFHFTQPDPSKPLRAAIFGDLSVYKGTPSINQLISATHDKHFDFIIHIGDIAYDLHDDEGNRGDDYMNAIQPFAAYVPYMVFAGNHESDTKFNHIVNRFTMPKNGVYDDNLFWSIDYGFVHFIALNSEYYAESMPSEAQAQYTWLEADLKKSKAQWKIVMFHRPWYCSTHDSKGCNSYDDMLSRKGKTGYPGLEKLLNEYKVDMILYGHKHTYERMWPINDGVGYKSSDSGHIKNAKAPVYMLTGGAGCHTHEGPSDSTPQPFSITRLGQYGYTRLKVYNSTHLSTYFVDTSDKVGNFLDRFYLEKD